MINQVILVGKITTIEEFENFSNIILEIPRNYKNDNGIYENDYIQIKTYGNLNSNTKEYCKKGDTIGIKGRLQNKFKNMPENTIIIAEKITFLSSKSNEIY